MKKVFFDTNFLLRFYFDNIPEQSAKAKNMVQAAKDGSLLLVTDLVVICEMVWVFDSFYKLDKVECEISGQLNTAIQKRFHKSHPLSFQCKTYRSK